MLGSLIKCVVLAFDKPSRALWLPAIEADGGRGQLTSSYPYLSSVSQKKKTVCRHKYLLPPSPACRVNNLSNFIHVSKVAYLLHIYHMARYMICSSINEVREARDRIDVCENRDRQLHEENIHQSNDIYGARHKHYAFNKEEIFIPSASLVFRPYAYHIFVRKTWHFFNNNLFTAVCLFSRLDIHILAGSREGVSAVLSVVLARLSGKSLFISSDNIWHLTVKMNVST